MKIILSKRRRQDGNVFFALLALLLIGVAAGGLSYHYFRHWMEPVAGPDPAANQAAQQYNNNAPNGPQAPGGTVIFMPGIYGTFTVMYLDFEWVPYLNNPVANDRPQPAPQDATGSATVLDHATIQTYYNSHGYLTCSAVNDSGWTTETLGDLGCPMDPVLDIPSILEGQFQNTSWGNVPDDTNTVVITILKTSDLSLPVSAWTNLASFSGYWDITNVYYDYDWNGTMPSAFYSAVYAFPSTPVILQPVISGTALSGADLVLSVMNGTPGWTYYVLASTNPAAPLNQWRPIATNILATNATSGDFTITITNAASVNATSPQFFVLKSY